MKKKLMAALFAVGLIVAGCSSTESYADNPEYDDSTEYEYVLGGYFVQVKEWSSVDAIYRIIVDPETGVEYFYVSKAKGISITPLYNADGSLKNYYDDGTAPITGSSILVN